MKLNHGVKSAVSLLAIGLFSAGQIACAADITGVITLKGTPPPEKEITPLMENPDCGKMRSEEHTSELQSLRHLVCRLLLEKKKINARQIEAGRIVLPSPPVELRAPSL